MNYQGNPLRHELKYFIGYDTYVIIKRILEKTLDRDDNCDSNGEYHIRSLYFDDIYDSSLYEKNFGVFTREKYRIRIYNYSDTNINLECKKKFDNYISKTTIKIPLEIYNKIMTNNIFFLKKQTGLFAEFHREITENFLRPKVIVDYVREAYTKDTSDIRITFDKQLSVAYNTNDIFDRNVASARIHDDLHMIMEVKFNEFLPSYLSDILGSFSLKQLAVSKYLMCRAYKNNVYY